MLVVSDCQVSGTNDQLYSGLFDRFVSKNNTSSLFKGHSLFEQCKTHGTFMLHQYKAYSVSDHINPSSTKGGGGGLG